MMGVGSVFKNGESVWAVKRHVQIAHFLGCVSWDGISPFPPLRYVEGSYFQITIPTFNNEISYLQLSSLSLSSSSDG